MNRIAFALALALACSGLASMALAQVEEVALTARGRQFLVTLQSLAVRAKTLTVEESFVRPEDGGVDSVEIGNTALGFVPVHAFEVTPREIRATFLPPSYLQEVEVRARLQGGGVVTLARHQYEDRRPEMIKNIGCERHGELSQPFYISGIALRDDQSTNLAFVAAVFNRLCEVVAYHVPARGEVPFTEAPTVKSIGQGRYLFLVPGGESYVEEFSFVKGRITSAYGREAHVQYTLQQDFDCADTACTMIHALSGGIAYLRPALFASQGVQAIAKGSWWRWALPPVSLRTDRIIRLDLQKNQPAAVWDVLQHLSPTKAELVQESALLQPEITMRSYKNLHANPDVWVEWGVKAHLDWTKATSLQSAPGGYLVTLENVRQVLFLKDTFREVAWSVGPDSTFVPSGDGELRAPAHAVMEDDGSLLVLDHSLGAVVDPEASPVMVKQLRLTGGKAELIANLSLPISVPEGGNILRTTTDSISVFLPSIAVGYDSVVELNRHSGAVQGELRLSNDYGLCARRAYGLDRL